MIKAPRELVYQMMSSFGSGRLKGEEGSSSRVLERREGWVLAEFTTRVGRVTVNTVEQVTLEPPSRMTFRHVKGPFHYAREEFTLESVAGGTCLGHAGEFAWSRLPAVGWMVGRLALKPAFERVLAAHMEKIRVAAEARAARSRVFPAAAALKPDRRRTIA
jgi:hypothetical protein